MQLCCHPMTATMMAMKDITDSSASDGARAVDVIEPWPMRPPTRAHARVDARDGSGHQWEARRGAQQKSMRQGQMMQDQRRA